MNNFLEQIIATKEQEVRQRKRDLPLETLIQRASGMPPARGFTAALEAKARSKQTGVIAEIKKASPSKGVIRQDFKPSEIARAYADHGATCISVLTDVQYFQGSDAHLEQVRASVDLPVIRKDFTIDEYQIYEAKALGADCILLIVSALSPTRLGELYRCALELELDVLIEVHDGEELETALALGPRLLGINNRNLKTFTTSLETTLELLPLIQNAVVVTESGIADAGDVARMRANGVFCFLVGEALMREADPGAALDTLISV